MDKKEDTATSGARDDFINEDGLLVCGKCGQPKQRRLPMLFGQEPMVVGVMCACEQKAQEERAAREEQLRRRHRAKELRDECFKYSGFYKDCTFAADDGRSPEQSNICQRFVATFDGKDPNGLLLWGEVGTGKTFLSSCIANALIDLGFSCLQTDINLVVSMMESSFEQRRRNLDRILSYDLLLIEDLGAQRSTDYMMEYVYTLIDGRYKAGKPMVITTNIPLHEISHAPKSSPWSRIYDRILERCYPVEFKGTSRRKEAGISMRRAMRERLGL